MKETKSNTPKVQIRSNTDELLKIFTAAFVILGLAILLGVGYFWYNHSYLNTERRFWIAVGNSLETKSVVKKIVSGGGSATDTRTERIYLSGERLIETSFRRDITGENTLSVSTQSQQYYGDSRYLRYSEYQANDGSELGDLVGKWSFSDTSGDEASDQQFVGELISIVMFADLPPEVLSQTIQDLKDQGVYEPNTDDAVDNGDGELLVPVKVNLKPYIASLKKVLEESGYSPAGLDPESVSETQTIDANITIRKRDNTILKISYNGIEEEYSDYGVVSRPERPSDTISYEELQQSVQEKLNP